MCNRKEDELGTMMAEVQAFVHQENPKWDRTSMSVNFIATQAQNRTFELYAATIGEQESKFNVDINGLLVSLTDIFQSVKPYLEGFPGYKYLNSTCSCLLD